MEVPKRAINDEQGDERAGTSGPRVCRVHVRGKRLVSHVKTRAVRGRKALNNCLK